MWTNLVDVNALEDRKYADQLVTDQAAAVMRLWNRGTIENVYFDIEGTQRANDVTDFVFFVNAANEAEAREIIHGLPFYRDGIARYNLYPVGVRWLDAATRK